VAQLPVPKNSPKINECIYCGSVEGKLSTEHAVPYGLNGPWTLVRASCKQCSDITQRFERDALKDLLSPIRTVLGLQTRRPNERTSTLPLVVIRNGIESTVDLPVSDYPGYLPAPEFPPPGVVVGRPVEEGFPVDLKFTHIRGPSIESLASMYPGASHIGGRVRFRPAMYARMVAKVAYCAAIYAIGIAPLRKSPIRSIILGDDLDVFHRVGGWKGEEVNPTDSLHSMQLRSVGSDLHVILRLFAQFKTQEFHVSLGPADEAFVLSPQWPWNDA
jgi:hypothetical protein